MDSTSVRMITDAATQLGMRAGEVLMIYMIIKVVIHLIWATTIGLTLIKLIGLLHNVGRGQILMTTINHLDDTWRVSPHAFNKAIGLLQAHWRK